VSRLSKASSVLLLAMVAAAEPTNTERTHIAVRLESAIAGWNHGADRACFLGCLVPCHGGPIGRSCLLLPRCHRPSPKRGELASRFLPRTRLFVGSFSRLQTFRYVQAPKFARLPDRAHRCGLAAGRPRLLHPGRACFVASARTEYASRPNQAIGGARTCTLLDSQSCRLLPLLSEQTGLSPSLRGLLLPGFRQIGHPHWRRI